MLKGKNPIIQTLFKEGATVVFDNNFAIKGLPKDSFIETCLWNTEDCKYEHLEYYDLTVAGIGKAIDDYNAYIEFLNTPSNG